MKVGVATHPFPTQSGESSCRPLEHSFLANANEDGGAQPDPVGRCHPLAGPRIPDALTAELRRLLAAILVADYRAENAFKTAGSEDEG